MVEEIITALSRIRWLFVIARNSSFSYKGQSLDIKQVGRELGVRYVLEGSVRKAGNRVRITAQLIDAATGTHLWADRFDGSLEDVFDLQDKVASSVAGVIEPALQAAETARSAARPTADLTAYDLCLRAQPLFWSLGKQGIYRALALLEEAIARDTQYGPALGWAAMCRLHMDINGWSEDPERNRLSGVDYARRALVADQEDAATLANAAYVLANFGEDIDTMLGIVDRALALNPSFARGWTLSGNMKIWAGDPDAAIERLETSLRLSPRARVSQPFILGMAYFYKRQFDQAARYLRTAIQDQPGSAPVRRVLAACYAHMGRLAEARDLIERLRAMGAVIEPNRSVSVHRNVEYQELFLSGLRLAAGEVT
jgi:adenylate cyclase